MKKRIRLIEARKNHNMSTRQVAEEVGVTKSMITQIENCRSKPGLDLAIKLENLFNIPIKELFIETEIKEKDL